MKQWNMIIDVARCHDCNDCFLADKDEFVGNDFPPTAAAQPWHGHRWMNIERKERGQYPLTQVAYLPKPCQHCDDAPCLTADGAVYKRPDGLVIIDPVKARGREEIVGSCPYGVIYWNDESKLAQKCNGCAHLVDSGWQDTRCSQVCPTDAIKLVLGDDAEMAEIVERDELETLHAELGTHPRVYYKNLHLWTTAFVAGSVADKDTDECAAGVTAVVSLDGVIVADAATNNYGEFVVDRLEPGKDYVVTLHAEGYESATVPVTLDTSRTLATVFLHKA